MKGLVKKYTLQNALKYNGKANPNAVLGKVLSENAALRKNIDKVKKEIEHAVKEVNALSLEEIQSQLEHDAPELLKKKQPEKKELPSLKKANKVRMRFEPSPSGALHIGHAYVLSLNAEYCKKYNGKLFLRIGDTNPENIYEPAYTLIEEDATWLAPEITDVLYQSDRLKIYYRYMEKLLDKEKVYVCTCDNEQFRELLKNKTACPCRDLPKKGQKERWKKMHSSYKQGEAVARLKTDINDKNPAMRDFPLFRINDTSHPRTKKKYRVWPLMNMSVIVDDIEQGMTHVIRAKDHADNAKRQEMVFEYLDKTFHQALFVGRINFTGMPLSATKTREAIEQGKYTGWDDIRLPFLPALRRRGYQAAAFRKYAIEVGMSLTDKTVSSEEFFKMLNALNKDIIDEKSHRFFFVEKPKRITIENAPQQSIELDLHPDNKKGGRSFKVEQEFYIAEADFKKLKEKKLYRLMDCLNFIKKGNKFLFVSLDYELFKEDGTFIMHWLPTENNVKAEVVMPDNTIKKGIGEKTLKKVKRDQIVQLERFGFVRCDEKKDTIKFWFAHK